MACKARRWPCFRVTISFTTNASFNGKKQRARSAGNHRPSQVCKKMENAFANDVLDFFRSQDSSVRLGILEFYLIGPPVESTYLLWNAEEDTRLSLRARQAAVVLDMFFWSKKNAYVSFELAHRQTAKLFKRLYLNKACPART